jgi:hypothetical protein
MAAKTKDGKPERIEIGFGGGQVVAVRVAPKELAELRRAVNKAGGWYDLNTEDGDLAIDLGQIVFIRVAAPEHRVGFSGA